MGKIKIAIAGVGNCASSLVQGIYYYKDIDIGEQVPGLMHTELGGYKISDIQPVAAFDIDKRKVGLDLSKAIFSKPNCTYVFQKDIPKLGVEVKKAPVLDGCAPHMHDYPEDVTFVIDKNQNPVNITDELKKAKADMLMNYLPVGSEEAVRYLAQCCLDAGVAMVNCMPVFIASDPQWSKKFSDKNLPVVGDDIKAEVGSTIVHRTLAKLFTDRGVKIDRTYQLNVGGNSVTGDQELLLVINNQLKRVKIGEFIDSYIDVYGQKRIDGKDLVVMGETGVTAKCFTIDDEYNVKLSNIDALIRHRIYEPIYEVTTDEGRTIKITGDHNVFVLSDDGVLTEIPVNMLKEGKTYIAVPKILPYSEKEDLKTIDITTSVNKFFSQGVKDGYLYIHNHPEIRIPVDFPITDDLLQIVGLWIADGNYDREGSSNIELACGNEPECISVVHKFTEGFNINYKIRSDGIGLRIVSKTLGRIFKISLGLTGNTYTKRVPDWVFDLSDRQIGLVLKGYMSGDGGLIGKQIRWTSVSRGLLGDIQTLLLRLGINSTIFKETYRTDTYAYKSSLGYALHGLISSKIDVETFINKVGFLQDYKNKAAVEAWEKLRIYGMQRIPSIKLFKKWRIKSTSWRKNRSMRTYIILSQLDKIKNDFEKEKIRQICLGGTRFLKIKSIKKIDTNDVYVYDISTKPFERFVCSNILVHNTDFLNMLSRERLKSKKVSKSQAVQSILPQPLEAQNLHIGPSDYVPWLKDRKLGFIRIEGRKFGDAPVDIEIRLNVEDSPNSAACAIDAIRCCKLALDRGIGGALLSSSAYFMKSPPQQFADNLAREMLEQFIRGERER